MISPAAIQQLRLGELRTAFLLVATPLIEQAANDVRTYDIGKSVDDRRLELADGLEILIKKARELQSEIRASVQRRDREHSPKQAG